MPWNGIVVIVTDWESKREIIVCGCEALRLTPDFFFFLWFFVSKFCNEIGACDGLVHDVFDDKYLNYQIDIGELNEIWTKNFFGRRLNFFFSEMIWC